MNNDRPDWVRCIAHQHQEMIGKAWCGRPIGPNELFQDIDHAAMYGQQGGRLVCCRECVAEIYRALQNGHDDPEYAKST